MPGLKIATKVKSVSVTSATVAGAPTGIHKEWNGAGGFKPGNQYGKRAGTTSPRAPKATPRPKKIPKEKTGLADRVDISKSENHKVSVERTSQHLDDLKAGKHEGHASVHSHIDKITKGAKKAELFDAAKKSGIEHKTKTKKDLVTHLKSIHADQTIATLKPDTTKSQGLTKRVEKVKQETQSLTTKESAISHLRDLQGKSHTIHPNDIPHEVDRVGKLKTADLKAVEKEFIGANVGKTKADILNHIQKKIDNFAASAHRTASMERSFAGKSGAGDQVPESKYLPHPGRAKPKEAKAKESKPPKPPKPTPELTAFQASHIDGLKSLQSHSTLDNLSDQKSHVESLGKLKAADLDAVTAGYLGTKIGGTKQVKLKAIEKKLNDFAAAATRVKGIGESIPSSPSHPEYGLSLAQYEVSSFGNPVSKATAEAVATRILGRKTTVQDIGTLSGATHDAKFKIDEISRNHMTITIDAPDYQAVRTIRSDPDGNVSIHNENFRAKVTGTGLGREVFGRQVEHAGKMGIDSIETSAGRNDSPHASDAMVGYKVWPKFGYDGPIPSMIRDKSGFPGGKNISDLMKSPEGRSWWDQHGITVDLSFDPRPGSPSRKIFDSYQAKKAAQAR